MPEDPRKTEYLARLSRLAHPFGTEMPNHQVITILRSERFPVCFFCAHRTSKMTELNNGAGDVRLPVCALGKWEASELIEGCDQASFPVVFRPGILERIQAEQIRVSKLVIFMPKELTIYPYGDSKS